MREFTCLDQTGEFVCSLILFHHMTGQIVSLLGILRNMFKG